MYCPLIDKFHNIFSNLPGKTNIIKIDMELTLNIPSVKRSYPLPFKRIEDIIKQEPKLGN